MLGKNWISRERCNRSQSMSFRWFRWLFGFTLAELIIVITILAILSTIAFVSFNNYSGNSRDSARTADISSLSKGLELAYVKSASLPNPDNSFTVTYSGWVVWTQGTISSGVVSYIGAGGGRINPKPVDPLSKGEYIYSKTAAGKEYQIKSDWEGDNIVDNTQLISTAYAATNNPTLTYIKGSYNGVALKTATGSSICFLATPSIIVNTGSSATPTIALETNNLLSGSLLFNGKPLAGNIFKSSISGVGSGSSIVYCSGAVPSTQSEQLALATNIATAYSGTSFSTTQQVQPYIVALTNNDAVSLVSLGANVVSNKTPTANSTTNVGDIRAFNCTAKPTTGTVWNSVSSYIQTWNGTAWTPSDSTTTYSTTSSTGSCNYKCDTGYTWLSNNCATAYTFNAVISANTANYNLSTAAVAAGWNGTSPLDATITVGTGIAVYSNTPATPAFLISASVTGNIKIINKGSIYGAGGSGGKGGGVDGGSGIGWNGGDAISLLWGSLQIDNTSGNIYGWGGGWGGGWMDGACNSVASGWGGGGGQGWNPWYWASAWSAYAGWQYPVGASGTSGSSSSNGSGGGWAYAGCWGDPYSPYGGNWIGIAGNGGNGGVWWSSWAAGQNGKGTLNCGCGWHAANPGASGWAGGYAIRKNGFPVTITAGDNTSQIKGSVQ